MAILKSEARPNHRRFADRLFKLEEVVHTGMSNTFYGVFVGIAGEVMAPGQGQRANVELVLAPAQGLNPDCIKLVVKTRTKQGLAKGSELLLDYGDAFDVTLPVLGRGNTSQMQGPMDLYMTRRQSPTRDADELRGHDDDVNNDGEGCDCGEEAPGVDDAEKNPKRQRTTLAPNAGGNGRTDGFAGAL